MQEIHKLRAQISAIVQSNYPGLDAGLDPKLKPPDETQVSFVPRRCLGKGETWFEATRIDSS